MSSKISLLSDGLFPQSADHIPIERAGVNVRTPPAASWGVCNGRLTLETGVPVSTADQTAKTTLYFTPHLGNQIGTYSGSAWTVSTFTEKSLALGTLTSGKNYDVFIVDSTLALELSAAWTNDTTRADALVLQDGVYVKAGATTRRWLGTIRTTSTTTTEDSAVKRFVWNAYNRLERIVNKVPSGSHSYNGNYRQWNADTANQIECVAGLAQDPIKLFVGGRVTTTATGIFGAISMGLDSTTAGYDQDAFVNLGGTTTLDGWISISQIVAPQIGYHFITLLESTYSTGATTFNVAQIKGVVWA